MTEDEADLKLEIEHNDTFHDVEMETGDGDGGFTLRLDGPDGQTRSVPVRLLSRSGDRWTLDVDGRLEDVLVSRNGDGALVEWRHRTFPVRVWTLRDRLLKAAASSEIAGAAELKAQMPGKVITVLKRAGDSVAAGEGLVIIESMKMQNELKSPKSGSVAVCNVEEGGSVNAGDLLYRVE